MSVVIIDSRSEEIKIMRLVGSSRFLIGAPIIVNGLLVGVLSAGLAAGIWTTAEKLTRHPSIALPLMPPVAPIMVMGIGIGFLIGLLSSLLALLRVQKWR